MQEILENRKAREILKQLGMTEIEASLFIDGCKKGTQAWKDGKVKSWSQVKKELGIED